MWFICVWTVAKLKEIDYKCIWYAEILQNTLSLFAKKLNFEYFGQNWALLSKIFIFQPKIAIMVENKKLQYSSSWWKMKKTDNYLWLRFINFHLPSICSAISYKFISIVPEFPLNSDIFCKNSLEIRCLNKFRFDIRPLYLNFYSLINSRIVSSVLEWWRHLTAFLPPLDSPQRDENLPRENVCCG